MKNTSVKKLTIAAVLIALGVALSPFSIPVGASRCFPVQAAVNIIAAVLLGPAYGTIMAFITSLLRVILGTGSLLAFPGSMCGALICALIWQKSKNLWLTCFGELFGTGIIGALIAYPIAKLFIKNSAAVIYTYIIPFLISTLGGVIIAAIIIVALQKTKVLDKVKGTLSK